jgi:iron complex transport system substrate-binding protein
VRCFRFALLFIFLLWSAIACLLDRPAHAESFQVTDALGRTLTFSKTPRRIVSLAPSITETLFALGVDQEIIGVTTSCDYPPQAKLKPKVGGLTTPNLETLVAMKPDLVISVKGLHKFELVSEMDRLKIPFYVSDPSTVKKILQEIRVIGRLTGRAKAGEQLSETMEKRIEAVEAKVRGHQRPAVLYVLWGDPLMTVGPGSYIEELIRISGGRGIVPEGRPAYTQLNMEEVLAEDPQVVIFASEMGDDTVAAERQRWLRWTTLSAVKEHRLYTVDSNLLHRPGPRLVDGLEALARLIHPELFPDQSAK